MSKNEITGGTAAGVTGSLNAFMTLDYMNMVIKEGIKDAVDEYRSTTISPGATGPQSLNALAAAYPANKQAPTGISRMIQIAQANQQTLLANGATLTYSKVSFVPPQGATLGGIGTQFGVGPTSLASVGTNPHLSFIPLPAGITTVQFSGPSGTTALAVTTGASFQTIAQQQGITGAAIDSTLLWPNLGVVEQLLNPGDPIQIPTFSKGITGHSTLISEATLYNLSLEALAAENAGAPIFGPTATVAIPQAQELTIGHLLDQLKVQGFGSRLAALAGRSFLHGLRVPEPGSPTGPRQGLYQITQQQSGVKGITAGSSLKLSYSGPMAPSWLSFGVSGQTGGITGGTGSAPKPHVSNFIGPTGMAQIQQLASGTTYNPTATFVPLHPYHIYPKSFTLAHNVTWNLPQNPLGETGIVPVSPTGTYGNGLDGGQAKGSTDSMGSNFILAFPDKLQSLLQLQTCGPTAMAFILKKTNHASGNSGSEVIAPYAWTSMLQVKIAQVPKSKGEHQDFVYALEGGSENEKSLLTSLLTENASPQSVFLLYPAHAVQKGQKSSTIALKSDTEPTVFVFHTNLSASLPPKGSSTDGEITQLLQQLWEADEVSEGGFYLYYKSAKAKGLPGYLFSQQPTAMITLLLTCQVPTHSLPIGTSYKLPPFVNSMVLNTGINAKSESLFIQPVANNTHFNPKLQTKVPTIHPGDIAFELSKQNPNRIGHIHQGVTHRLDELYSILEARIPDQAAFNPSKPGLPIGPRNPSQGITATPSPTLAYDVNFPISHLAKSRSEPIGGTGPSSVNDPYAGVGATLTVDFNMLDIFGNTLTPVAGPAWLSKTTIPGYTDSLIGIDNWPHIIKTFRVDGNGKLVIDLSFNANFYFDFQVANPHDIAALTKAAEGAQKSYQQIWYQLNQPDVLVKVITSLEPGLEMDVTTSLLSFVTSCWVSIRNIVDTLNNHQPLTRTNIVSRTFQRDISDSSLLDIFPLTVKVDITRTGTIDPNFKDIPSVQNVTSHIVPQTQAEATSQGATGSNHLAYFSRTFEQAFPNLKVATGQAGPTPSSAESQGKGIWAVRLGPTAGAAGIYLSLQNTPTYYAPRPVATSLVSRSKVPIYSIKSNETLQESINADPGCTGANCHLKNFTGLDIGTLARQFLAAFDQVLGSDMAAAAAIASPDDFKKLLSYKQTLAGYLSTSSDALGVTGTARVLPIFDDSTPPIGGPEAAGQALKNELLVGLSRLHKIETIVQNEVKTHWINPNQPDTQVEFFGKFSPHIKTKKPAFAFSSSSIPISKGPTRSSHLTALFNINHSPVKSSREIVGSKPDFIEDVTFHITALAHQIGHSNSNGHPKEWLSFVQPFELGKEVAPGVTATPPPINLDIPLPLKAYPTSPALKSQADVPLLPQFGQALAAGSTTTLSKATDWAYRYNYQYTGAAQDTISTILDFNVGGATGGGAKTPKELDLVDNLLQFKASYDGLESKMANLQLFLANNKAATTESVQARFALTSFCQIVERVTHSWKNWEEYQKKQAYQYEIEQYPVGPTAAPNLSIQVKKVKAPSGVYPHTNIAMPSIEINGFSTCPPPPTGPTSVGPNATEVNYTFEAVGVTGASGPSYLSWAQRDQHPMRTVQFPQLNVLEQENAWAGLGILRNKDLQRVHGTTGPFRPVNSAFVYETPLVKFVNVLNPMLDPAGEIIISSEVSPTKHNVASYLTGLFTKLLLNLPTDSSVQVKLGVSYGYHLGPDLPVELPMFLTTPHDYKKTGDEKFINMISGSISTWFTENNIVLINGEGSIVFDLTIFSTVSKSKLPILRLRKLVLPCKDVTQS